MKVTAWLYGKEGTDRELEVDAFHYAPDEYCRHHVNMDQGDVAFVVLSGINGIETFRVQCLYRDEGSVFYLTKIATEAELGDLK